jgi:hypothetical protein
VPLRAQLVDAVISSGRAVFKIVAASAVSRWMSCAALNEVCMPHPSGVDPLRPPTLGTDEHRFRYVR